MSGQIEVRPVRAEEYTAAGQATANAYREFIPPGVTVWHAYLELIADVAGRAGKTTVLVALVDGAIAGTATVELDQRVEPAWRDPVASDQAHLRMLGVDPAYRRRGVARALMQAVIELARAHNRTRLTLETTPQMLAAQRMYESMGFEARGREAFEGMHLLNYELRLPARC
ncbi:MAG: GNAT family N-acetyltransferase [Candidatus Dormibacteria bacterium]